jgi:hypothetical protein
VLQGSDIHSQTLLEEDDHMTFVDATDNTSEQPLRASIE